MVFSKREDRDLQSRYTQAQIGVLESEKARNEAQTAETLSAIARAAQPSSPRGVIAPRGQVGTPGVDGPANQIERFGTPLGYVDANKRFADSEEVERRWGDVARSCTVLAFLFMSCRQILLVVITSLWILLLIPRLAFVQCRIGIIFRRSMKILQLRRMWRHRRL